MKAIYIGYIIFAASTLLAAGCLFVKGSYRFYKTVFTGWALLALLTLLHYVAWRLTGSGFNASIPYHWEFGIAGAGIADFLEIQLLAAGGFVLIALLFLVFRKKFRNKPHSKHHYYFPAFLFAGLIPAHPLSREVYATYFNPCKTNIPAAMYFKKPVLQDSSLILTGKKYNLVWIYAESLERTYFNDSIFPGLVPQLKKLEAGCLSFTDVRQLEGTGWTIAGIVASQTGTPLYTLGMHANALSKMKTFLPGAVSMTDILHQNGYYIEQMQGSSAKFAGTDKYLASHHCKLTDLSHFKKKNPGLQSPHWGMYDDDLLDAVQNKYRQLQQADTPFALFISTIDTHHPYGRVSPRHKGRPYGDGKNSILNSVYYTDSLLGAFIQNLKRMDTENNTLIVIGSDHLAMPNEALDLLYKGKRRNMLAYYWPGHIRPRFNPKPASTLDAGVTAMDLLGFHNIKLGFGRSLISSDSTHIQRYPYHADFMIKAWERDMYFLWR